MTPPITRAVITRAERERWLAGRCECNWNSLCDHCNATPDLLERALAALAAADEMAKAADLICHRLSNGWTPWAFGEAQEDLLRQVAVYRALVEPEGER